jgi:hypothetical protein
MTITVSNTANTNTFDYWRNRTNELAHAMSNFVVTTDSNTAVGNAEISNAFTANVLIANTIRVSNTTSNIVISVPNTFQISSGDYFLNANGSWTPSISPVTSLSTNTTGTTSQEIDNYDMSIFGGVEFFVRVKNNIANGYHATKILTFHNTVNAFSTEYGVLTSNGSLGSFAVSTNATHVILSMTPTSSNTSVNISRVNF